ncbi:hypothetical protein [Anabaena sp. CCY 9910]
MPTPHYNGAIAVVIPFLCKAASDFSLFNAERSRSGGYPSGAPRANEPPT